MLRYPQLAISLLTIAISASESHEKFTFRHQALSLMDGGIRGDEALRNIYLFYQEVNRILEGTHAIDTAGEKCVKGYVIINDTPCTLTQLAELEQQADPNNQEFLSNALKTTTSFFMDKARKPLADAQNKKQLSLFLIDQWCEHYKRPDSYLKNWGNLPEGAEEEHFGQTMTSLTKLRDFLLDLRIFLRDFINSLPKSKRHLAELLNKK